MTLKQKLPQPSLMFGLMGLLIVLILFFLMKPTTDQQVSHVIDDNLTDPHAKTAEPVSYYDETVHLDYGDIVPKTLRKVTVSLWQKNPKAKANYNTEIDGIDVDEKYFMDFNFDALNDFRNGDTLNIVTLDGVNTEIVIGYDGLPSKDSTFDKTEVFNEAREWVFTNKYGKGIGKMLSDDNFVEGQFIASNGKEYMFRVQNSSGWILPKKDVISLIAAAAKEE